MGEVDDEGDFHRVDCRRCRALYFGGQAFNSVSSDVSRVFTGSPTNKAIMLIVGGVVATIAGLTGMALSGRKR
jgi:hypothetical protein